MSLSIDLKWSLWSSDLDHWEEYAGVALACFREALEREERVTIYTAPRKEIRSGVVEAWKEIGTYHADVAFHAEWDDDTDLVGDLNLSEEHAESVRERVPRNDHGDPGVSVDQHVEAPTFEALLVAIDGVEDTLLKSETEAWSDFETLFEEVSA